MEKIYVCGPTVYSEPHIGNFRPILSMDFYLRYLSYFKKDYVFIHNITDIDDKIIMKSNESGVSPSVIIDKNFNLYKEALEELNILKPSAMPRVTTNINQIIDYIKLLIKMGYAYKIDQGIYFRVSRIKEYGEISKNKLSELKSHDEATAKESPNDFVIWKFVNDSQSEESPWGKGRPGWHTECSALIHSFFKGKTIDIHGGGSDLIFPHNENENSQHRATTNKPLAKRWMHFGMMSIDNNKMSKSKGNIISISEFKKNNDIDSLRYIYLKSNWSAPLNITSDLIIESNKAITQLKKAYYSLKLSKISKGIIDEEVMLMKEMKFSEYLKILNNELKKYNKNEVVGNKLLGLICFLGFSFKEKHITKEMINKYEAWINFKKNSEYNEADNIRSWFEKKGIII